MNTTYEWPIKAAEYEAVIRSQGAMRTFFGAIVDEYPRAYGMNRLDKWAEAAKAYIDFMATAERAAARATQEPGR